MRDIYDHIKKSLLILITVFTLFLGVFTGFFSVYAENGNHGKKEVVNVGFFAFDGYHMIDENGTRSGYGYDFLQKLGTYTGWTYNYVGYEKSWSDMQEMLLDGTIDMVTSAQKTEDRLQKFAFSNESIGTNYAVLTVKSGNTKYVAGDYATYDGMKIGILNNSSRNAKLAEFAQQKGFTYTTVSYDDTTIMELALQNGSVDALLTSSLRVISNEWIMDEFDSADFYVMVRKDHTELLNRINTAIEELDNNYPDWRNELWNKYYQADTGNQISFTADERKYIEGIKNSGTTLTAIMEPDRIPYSYFSDGTAKGIMPEILHKIEDATGLTFSIIEPKDRNEYNEILASDQHIDVRIDTYADYYQAENSGYKITDSYLTANIDKISGKSDSEVIAVLKKADMTEARKDLLNGTHNLLFCDSYADCVEAVKNGSAGSTYLYTYLAQYYIDTDTTGSLQTVALPQYNVSFSLGVAVDDDNRLLQILDKAVRYVQGSVVQEIILDQTNSVAYSLTFFEFLMQYPLLLVAIFTVLGLLIGLLVLSFYRQHSIRLIAQKNKDLENAIHDAETANAAKSTFLSSMSHDMRTPLNGIIGFTDFALRTNNVNQKQEYLKKVQKSSMVLKNLVNDTLTVSRIESGKTTLNPEFTSTKEIYENLTLVIASAAEEKGLAFNSSSTVPDDLYVLVDKIKLSEIFMNLLSNAIKYTPKGGTVWFDVTYEEINDHSAKFMFVIKDNGIGMSKEFQKKMFESFTQEDQNTNNMEGTGLGLYIVKKYVDLMDGTISAESEQGKGTTFYVSFVRDFKIKDEDDTYNITNYDFTGRKILIAEDNKFNQEIAKTLLAEKGAEVTLASDGQEAVDLFKNSEEEYYAAVFMDVHMPNMGGYEATEIIRSMDRKDAKIIPIIAMTADAYDQDVLNCMNAGMNAHVAKPIDTEHLYSVLDEMLKK